MQAFARKCENERLGHAHEREVDVVPCTCLGGESVSITSHPVSAWPTSRPTWHPVRKRSRTLDSRAAWPRWTSHRAARVSPSVPAGRTTPAVAAPPVEAAPVPAGAAPPAAVPTIPVASPTELDRLRKPKMIGGVMQAQWSSNNAGVRATASRRHDRRSSHQGEHPYNRFPHDFSSLSPRSRHLGREPIESPQTGAATGFLAADPAQGAVPLALTAFRRT
jgi:hypothetical protein